MDSLEKVNKNLDIEFIKQHPNYFLSTNLLAFFSTTFGQDLTKELFILLSEDMKESKYGKQIKSYLDSYQKLKIGDKIVDILLPNKKGENVNLYSIKSDYILVDFWSSGCGPCRSFNSKLSKNYKNLKDKGLEVFSVSFDTNIDNWIKASEKDGISWINLNDKEGPWGKIGLTFGIYSIPTNYLINSNKEIIAKDIYIEDLIKLINSKN